MLPVDLWGARGGMSIRAAEPDALSLPHLLYAAYGSEVPRHASNSIFISRLSSQFLVSISF